MAINWASRAVCDVRFHCNGATNIAHEALRTGSNQIHLAGRLKDRNSAFKPPDRTLRIRHIHANYFVVVTGRLDDSIHSLFHSRMRKYTGMAVTHGKIVHAKESYVHMRAGQD